MLTVDAADTIGGIVVELLGRIPEVGEVIPLDGHEIIVKVEDQRRIISVEIRQRFVKIQ